MPFRRPSVILLSFLAPVILLPACAGPRMKALDEEQHRRRPRNYPIDVYMGRVLESHREIAIIDTMGLPSDDEASRERELEELRRKARELGGDAVHRVRLLTKQVRGYTVDERVPFPSWKQGEYPLYFMRGVVVVYESGMPGAVSSGEGFTDSPEGYIPATRAGEIRRRPPAGDEPEETDSAGEESGASDETETPPVREDDAAPAQAPVEIPAPPPAPGL